MDSNSVVVNLSKFNSKTANEEIQEIQGECSPLSPDSFYRVFYVLKSNSGLSGQMCPPKIIGCASFFDDGSVCLASTKAPEPILSCSKQRESPIRYNDTMVS